MKTNLTLLLFVSAILSLAMYSCQKEETVRITPPNKTTTTVATTVPTQDPANTGGGGTSKPTGGNPGNPSPNTPSNPNHPPIGPDVNISNSASCRNCHIRVETTNGVQWGTTGTFTNTDNSTTHSGMRVGSSTTEGE